MSELISLNFSDDLYLGIVIVIFGIGLVYGNIIGRGIVRRVFHGRKSKIGVIIIFAIIVAGSVISVDRFSNSEEREFSFSMPANTEESFDMIYNTLGLKGGIFGWVTIIIPITVFLLGCLAGINGEKLRFVRFVGLASFGMMMIFILTPFAPDDRTIALYAALHAGNIFGVFIGSRAYQYF